MRFQKGLPAQSFMLPVLLQAGYWLRDALSHFIDFSVSIHLLQAV